MTRKQFQLAGYRLMGHAVIPYRTQWPVTYQVGACPDGGKRTSWRKYVDDGTSWQDCYDKLVLLVRAGLIDGL